MLYGYRKLQKQINLASCHIPGTQIIFNVYIVICLYKTSSYDKRFVLCMRFLPIQSTISKSICTHNRNEMRKNKAVVIKLWKITKM